MVESTNPILDYGVINFAGSRREAKADFLRCKHTVNVPRLQDYLSRQFKLPAPGLVVQITGSAQDFDLPATHMRPITEGLVSVASVADAWIISGGLDAGVMSLVGRTMARWKHKCEKAPLIGVGAWRAVTDRSKLEHACGGRVEYCPETANSPDQAGLEPNHTQFILVDNPETDSPWGGELDVLEALQARLMEKFNAPTVLVVIQGGGGTLQTVLRALKQGMVAVVAADSGKCASAIEEYVRTGEVPADWSAHAQAFHEIKAINRKAASKDDLNGVFNNEWPLINLFFLRGRDHIGETILQAVLRQSSKEKQLEFAVSWDRVEILEDLLSTVPAYEPKRKEWMKKTLQQALELERPDMVKVALHHGAPFKELDLRCLYMKLTDPSQCRHPLFHSDHEQVEERRNRQRAHSPGTNRELNLRQAAKEDPPQTPATKAKKPTLTSAKPLVPALNGVALISAVNQLAAKPSGRSKAGKAVTLLPAPPPAQEAPPGALRRATSEPGFETPKRAYRPTSTSDEGEGSARAGSHDEASEVMRVVFTFYPPDVWRFLGEVTPGLHAYWKHKITSKIAKKEAALDAGADPDDVEVEHRVRVRTLDLYIWAVLLSNTELAMVLLSGCEEPMRAGILGAKICNKMAEMLPIEEDEFKDMAKKYEAFSIALLDLCPSQKAAATLLITPSRHWERNVLQLAASSEMKEFIAHRHVQQLCERSLYGDIEIESIDPCKAMLPKHFQVESRWSDFLYLLLHALVVPLPFCCGIIQLRPAPTATPDEVRWSDFYRIPHVKLLLRKVLYQLFAVLFAFVVLSDEFPHMQNWLTTYLYLPDMTYVLAWWTLALILDEWHQWVVAPQTFEFDLWNIYDYFLLSLTALSLTLKIMDEYLSPTYVNSLFASAGHLFLPFLFPAPVDDVSADQAGALQMRALRGGSSSGHHGYGYDDDTATLVPARSYDAGGIEGFEHGLLALLNIVVWTRVLQHHSSSRSMGVLIIMILEMVEDMWIWMTIVTIFMVAFSVTFSAITEGGYSDALQALHTPMWAMFGELGDPNMGSSLQASVLWTYVMLSNVLLVNLLIAMMNDTYQKISEKADIEWKFGRTNAILEAVERSYPVPPPFSLPFMVGRFVLWVCSGCSTEGYGVGNATKAAAGEDEWAMGGQLWQMKRERQRLATVMLLAMRRKEEEEEQVSVDGRLERMEKLVEEVMVFEEETERSVTRTREQIKGGVDDLRKEVCRMQQDGAATRTNKKGADVAQQM